ncbi:hypothetical protein BGZ72_010287 [Mortierella alpina]|nr:hypothetical protein BGZ72_010287 [Mortierella alpina]
MPTSPLFRSTFSPGTGPVGSTGTGSSPTSTSGSGFGAAAGGAFFSSYLNHHHPIPQGTSRQSRPTSLTSLSLVAGTSYASAHVSSAFFRTAVRPDTETAVPDLLDMEGIDMSDDEQSNSGNIHFKEPGARIDTQSEEGVDGSDESGESSSDEMESADGEDSPEEEEEEEEEEWVEESDPVKTGMAGSTASIFEAFKRNGSGEFFQSLGRRSEERTVHGSETQEPSILCSKAETPVMQQLDGDFAEQQQQQQQQEEHALSSAEAEHLAILDQEWQDDTPLLIEPDTILEIKAAADQNLQDDTLLQAVAEAIRETEATADQNPQEETLPQALAIEQHEGFGENDDRALTEVVQQVEAHNLIDEGVFYEENKNNIDMDTPLALPVAHHQQAEEEEEGCRNERSLADMEDSSEFWKGDPLQNLESEITVLKLAPSPPIEPYRVLRRQSSEEEFMGKALSLKTPETKNTALSSDLARKATQGLKNLPMTAPMDRPKDMDHDIHSSSGDSGQLGYELLHPRFTSLRSSLASASARVVSFSLLNRSDSASSPSTVASAEVVRIEQLGLSAGTKQAQQDTSLLSSTSSASSEGTSAATANATTATLATELGQLQTSVSSLHQRLDRIEQALDISSRRRTDLGRRTVLGVVRMVVKQGVISAVIIMVVFVVLYRRRSPVAMVVMAHVQRQLRAAMGIGETAQGGGWKVRTGGGPQSRWRTLMARLL